MQVGIHTLALWLELSGLIPQLALGRGGLVSWPCSGVPPCTPCPRSPQGWARGSGSSKVSCWKPRCCSRRESGLGRGAHGSAEPQETGSARGCPSACPGVGRVRPIRRGDTRVTPGSGCTNSPRGLPIKRWLLLKPLLDTKHDQVESTLTARGIASRQKLGMVELDSLWICLGICHLPLFV